MLTVISDWGPETLLAVVIMMFMSGLLLPSRTVNKMLAGRDKAYADMEEYYKSRNADLKEIHSDVTAGLRHTNDITSQALNVSVSNVRKLVDQQDELLDLARVTSPALIAQRNALESTNGPG